MPAWATFAGFAGVVLAALLLLARASEPLVRDDVSPGRGGSADTTDRSGRSASDTAVRDRPATDRGGSAGARSTSGEGAAARTDAPSVSPGPAPADRRDAPVGTGESATRRGATDRSPVPSLSTAALLANVALSQGAFGLLLLGAAWYTEIPASAFGVGRPALPAVGLGVGLGVALYVANEVGAGVGERFGLGGGEALREALAPESPGGWAVLLLVVLPVIAGFEELLFRGVLVGVFSAGFGVSPWLLALGSSVAFAVGHGAQGRIGVLVTGMLGFALAAAFVATGSLLVVVLAHYLVNALEFVVHEGLGLDPFGRGRETRGADPDPGD